jgi:hypothetical protein
MLFTIALTVRSVVVAAIVEIVIVAQASAGFESSVEIALDQKVWIFTVDAEHDIDALLSEDVGGAWSHAAREYHGGTLFANPRREDPAAVFGWGIDMVFADGPVGLVHGIEGKCLGATEVRAEFALVYWNCDSHIGVSFSYRVF